MWGWRWKWEWGRGLCDGRWYEDGHVLRWGWLGMDSRHVGMGVRSHHRTAVNQRDSGVMTDKIGQVIR